MNKRLKMTLDRDATAAQRYVSVFYLLVSLRLYEASAVSLVYSPKQRIHAHGAIRLCCCCEPEPASPGGIIRVVLAPRHMHQARIFTHVENRGYVKQPRATAVYNNRRIRASNCVQKTLHPVLCDFP